MRFATLLICALLAAPALAQGQAQPKVDVAPTDAVPPIAQPRLPATATDASGSGTTEEGAARVARPDDAAAAAKAAAKPETIVAGLSQDAVSITASFNGSEILIFGAVKRDAPMPEKGLDVIVTVQGPAQNIKVRKKERRLGIWVNAESVRVGAAPEFYAVATTAPLNEILDPADDTRFRISLPLALRSFAGNVDVQDTRPFTEAMVRLREDAAQYRLDDGAVKLIDQTLFRADIRLPANLVEGAYKARIFLVRDGHVIDSQSAPIEVRKVGLERWLYHLAIEQPFWYGILSLALAVGAGWAASAMFRAFGRK